MAMTWITNARSWKAAHDYFERIESRHGLALRMVEAEDHSELEVYMGDTLKGRAVRVGRSTYRIFAEV